MLGRVSGLFGISGWVKVYSYTRPIENILDFSRWWIGRPGQRHCFTVVAARAQSKTLIAHLADARGPLADRDAALGLLDCDIAVAREAMPTLARGEYYWFDLIGLEVVNREGAAFGTVQHMMETGANDVLVVAGERERLIPFVLDDIVIEVDIDGGRMVVDWEPDF